MINKLNFSKIIKKSFFSIPRELFIDKKYYDKVYFNNPISIGYNQLTTKPSLICEMIKYLDVNPSHNVLEIGTGTGFNASIISTMVKNITSIEIIKPLIFNAKKIIDLLQMKGIIKNNINLIHGDGSEGYKKKAPYDRIIFTAGKQLHLPIGIENQLKEGGIIVIPLLFNGREFIFKFIKKHGKMIKYKKISVNFVPLKTSKIKFNNLKIINKDYSGIVNGNNLNELLIYHKIGIQKCNLFNIIKKKINPKTLISFITIPRELFMPFIYIKNTYIDSPHPLAYKQTISQPSLVCKMIDYLKLKSSDKVLEIGTGYGYNAAILSKLCKKIITMDIIIGLVEGAREVFNFLINKKIIRNNILLVYGDGYKGYPIEKYFDKIIVTCGADGEVPKQLIEQLSPNGGICVIPIKNRVEYGREEIYRYTKNGNNIKEEQLIGVRFVPFIKKNIKTKIIK